MKKLFLFLAIFMWMDVSAKTTYTDYEFQGYIEEKLEEDELHKYESIQFNKFYREIETNVSYLEGLNKRGFDRVDETDIKKQKCLSEEPVINYENEKKMVIYSDVNYEIDKIWFEEASNFFETINVLKIFYKETPLTFTTKIEDDIIEIDLGGTYNYIDLSIYLEYEAETSYTFKYKTYKPNGNKITNKIVLESSFNSTTIYSLVQEDFQEFIIEHHFNFREVLHYYVYEKILYKHYNIKREYYIDSEEMEIEGYKFDPEESYILYKVYERKKIEEPDESAEPNIPENKVEDMNDGSETPKYDKEKEPDGDENDSKKLNKDTSISSNEETKNQNKDEIKQKVPTLITHNTTNIYKCDSVNTERERTLENEEVEKIEKELYCNCNLPENILLKGDNSTCEKSTRAEILKTIGEILLIIALLQFILYEFSVKRKNKNG